MFQRERLGRSGNVLRGSPGSLHKLAGRRRPQQCGRGHRAALLAARERHRETGPLRSSGKQRTVAHDCGSGGDTRNESVRELRHHTVYLPHGEFQFGSVAYVVRTSGGLANPESALRARLAAVDKSVAISRVLTMKEVVGARLWQERFFAIVFGAFAMIALLLAMVGLYGVMAYTVSERTHEMGIRMALGASRGEIRGMILLETGRLVAIGLALGAAGAAALIPTLKSQLYEVKPADPGTMVAVGVLLAGAALLASYLPARKATSIDPMAALRQE